MHWFFFFFSFDHSPTTASTSTAHLDLSTTLNLAPRTSQLATRKSHLSTLTSHLAPLNSHFSPRTSQLATLNSQLNNKPRPQQLQKKKKKSTSEGCLHQNWKGRVVVLSVDSWAPGNNVISSPEECSRVCAGRTIDGVTANAFSFCDRRDGCGQGCLNFQRGGASNCADVSNQICMGPKAVYGFDNFGGRIVPGCIGDRYRYA